MRRLLLVGSRARVAHPDDLADVDVQVYAETTESYTQDYGWLSGIGTVWVYVSDEYLDGDIRVPTLLVIFEGGVKVDFAFYQAGHVSNGVGAGLPHRVLLDKDQSHRFHPPTPFLPSQREPPSAEAFSHVVQEFWFEAYHVAKYLARNELWLAKSRDWATKELLLTMIDWHEHVVHGRAHETGWAGERSGMSPETWESLQQTFAAFGCDEMWDAAVTTTCLFRRLASEVAGAAGFAYPDDIDKSISGFILDLRDAHQGARN